jgi:hypothetical protein
MPHRLPRRGGVSQHATSLCVALEGCDGRLGNRQRRVEGAQHGIADEVDNAAPILLHALARQGRVVEEERI